MRGLILSACLLGFAASSLDAAPLLVWDFGSSDGAVATAAATTVDPGLQSSTLSRGANMPGSACGFQPTRGSFTTDASSAPGTLATAVTGNAYFQFNATPQAGVAMSVSGIEFSVYQQNAHAGASVAVQYSLDGFATAGIDVGSVTGVTSDWGGSMKNIDLSGIAGLQNIGQAVTFRLYYYGFGAYEQRGLGQIVGANTDLGLNGSVAAVPEPAGASVLVLGSLAIFLKRRSK